MGVLRIMGSYTDKEPGDSKLVWNSQNSDETEAAREMFRKLKAKGFLAYSVKPGGEKGELIREFDPFAEKIIMAPQLVGG